MSEQTPIVANADGSIVVEGVTVSAANVAKSKEYMGTCVNTILTEGNERMASCSAAAPAKKAPDGKAAKMKSACAMAFNTEASVFLKNMSSLFPEDMFIKQMLLELKMCMRGKLSSVLTVVASKLPEGTDPVFVPALLFAQQVQQKIAMPDGTVSTITDLIKNKDETLITADYNVSLLKGMDFRDKYKKLNANNQEYVWKKLNSLVLNAAGVILVKYDNMGEVDDLINAVVHKGKQIASKSGGRVDIKTASKLVSTDKDVRKLSKRVVEHAMEGDSNVSHKDEQEQQPTEVQKMSVEDFGEYISGATGRMIDVTGLADREGMIDLSEAGVERIVTMMASQGVSNVVHKGTAKDAMIRKRLQQKLLMRQQQAAAAQSQAATSDHQHHETDKARLKRTRAEVDALMEKMHF